MYENDNDELVKTSLLIQKNLSQPTISTATPVCHYGLSIISSQGLLEGSNWNNHRNLTTLILKQNGVSFSIS